MTRRSARDCQGFGACNALKRITCQLLEVRPLRKYWIHIYRETISGTVHYEGLVM